MNICAFMWNQKMQMSKRKYKSFHNSEITTLIILVYIIPGYFLLRSFKIKDVQTLKYL